MAAYSGCYVTTPSDTQEVVADTAEAIDVATTAQPESGITHASSSSFTVAVAGVYRVMAVATLTHSVNNTVLHMEIAEDGVVDSTRNQERKVGTGGDIGNMSVRGHFTVAAGCVLNVHIKADKTGTVTYNHYVCDVERVDD